LTGATVTLIMYHVIAFHADDSRDELPSCLVQCPRSGDYDAADRFENNEISDI